MSDGRTEAMRGSYFSDSKYINKEQRVTPEKITKLKDNEVFIFGSNKSGRHGKGAAKQAIKWGAIYGQGEGIQGQTYAIPTKDNNIKTLPIIEIQKYVGNFIEYACKHKDQIFLVTPIGCGLAGYSESDIAPLFKNVLFLTNIHLPENFWKYII